MPFKLDHFGLSLMGEKFMFSSTLICARQALFEEHLLPIFSFLGSFKLLNKESKFGFHLNQHSKNSVFILGFVSSLYTVSLNADIHFRNELKERGPNPCLWVHRQCKIMVFKIPAHGLFQKRQEIQFYGVIFFVIFEKTADFHRVKNGLCAGILKIMILHCLCTHKHELGPLFLS